MVIEKVDLRNKTLAELRDLKKHYTHVLGRASEEFKQTQSPVEHQRVKQCHKVLYDIKVRIKKLVNC